jgi:hypothetical protein
LSGSAQSPARENLGDGPSPTVVAFVHTPFSKKYNDNDT